MVVCGIDTTLTLRDANLCYLRVGMGKAVFTADTFLRTTFVFIARNHSSIGRMPVGEVKTVRELIR